MTSSSISAKNILSVLISEIPSTTTSDDSDYIIIESTALGTRIIQKKDLIASSNLSAGEGLKMEDSKTIGIDFENIYGSGLSAANSQIYVNKGLGLSADADDRLYVNLNQLLSAGAPSSLQYWNQSGISAIHYNQSIVKTKPLFWTKTGALSSIELTNSGDILSIDSSNNPVIVNVGTLSIPKKMIVGAMYGSLTATFGVSPTNGTEIAIWNDYAFHNTFTTILPTVVTDYTKIMLPDNASYYIEDGFYAYYHPTYTAPFITVDLYNSSDAYIRTVASSNTCYSGYDHFHHMNIGSCIQGTFSLSAGQTGCYLKATINGHTGYSLLGPVSVAGKSRYALYGSITIVQSS